MSDSDELFKVKRGRPKKHYEHIKLKSSGIPNSSSLTISRHYSDLQIIYTSNMNQKLRNMILRVPMVVKFPDHILQLQLQNILEEIVKQLMISELELVGFTLVLDRVLIKNFDIPPEEMLKLCFFISKNVFESNKEVLLLIKLSLKSQFKNFERNLKHLSQGILFTIKEINKRYVEIEKNLYLNINYTYYVDDIMRISPPYQILSRKRLQNENNTNKKPFKIRRRKRKLDTTQGSTKLKSIVEETKDDQQLALDYYNLKPLEEKHFYLYTNYSMMDRNTGHTFESMDDEFPKLYDYTEMI